MGTLGTVAAIVLTISFMTFVAFFGRLPVFRRTPIAWLHRLVFTHIPQAILYIDQKLTSGKFTSSLQRFGTFMMYDKHPTVLIFFLLLLSVSEVLAVPPAWELLSTFHKITFLFIAALPYIFLYLAAHTDPGVVELGNLKHHMQQYPYDYALFHPGARCDTCNLLKPPRSKHCSVCKRCVGRMDHHCIFINNCVGIGNHRWFLLLLASTALLTTYGGCLGMGLVSEHIRGRYATWSLWPWSARKLSDPSARLPLHEWIIVYSWGLKDRVSLGSVSLLAVLVSPLVWGLFLFNMFNVYAGQTTSESLKWEDWKYDMADDHVFRRRLAREQNSKDRAAVGASSAWTRWPLEAEHVLVRTESGQPPPSTENLGIPGVGPWARIHRLREVENMYDLGFWNNLADIMIPDYQFHVQGLPSQEVRGRPRNRMPRS